jgi:hypothetical protein
MVDKKILHGLGFHHKKRKDQIDLWVNDYPCATKPIEIYESYDLSTIVNAIFEAGREAGQIQMAKKIEGVIHNYIE